VTYANVISTVALFVALGGGAYAAVKLPADSVGPRQLQDNAVSSRKVLDGSLLAGDFKRGQLPAGPMGPQGPAGPAGTPGVSGLEVVYAASASGPGAVKDAEAQCPAGKKVTGGGTVLTAGSKATVTASAPGAVPNPTSWYAEARQYAPADVDWTLFAYAVCATTAP
jgi:hypothetical protein